MTTLKKEFVLCNQTDARSQNQIWLILTSLLILIINICSSRSFAESTEPQIPKVHFQEGEPIELTYAPDRIARVERREVLDFFSTQIKVRENRCTDLQTSTCELRFPFIRQFFAARWLRHPSRNGQVLVYKDGTPYGFGIQQLVTKSQPELFSKIAKRIPPAQRTPEAQTWIDNDLFAEVVCEGVPLQQILGGSQVLFWDEYYESGNSELAPTQEYGKRVNMITRRFQDLQIVTINKRTFLKLYKRSYGTYVDENPFGIAYEFTTWISQQPNQRACAIKWENSFSLIFAQYTQVATSGGRLPLPYDEYRQLRYEAENPNPFMQKVIEAKTWQLEGRVE